jgi:excisionase family DNA binding protein
MGRQRKRALFPIALSADAAAEALQVPRRAIADAIKSAELPAYAGPGRRIRITVTDLVAWVQTWPRATIKQRSQS